MRTLRVTSTFSKDSDCVLFDGDCRDLLHDIPDNTLGLVVTSPPYNIGKSYETRTSLDRYLDLQREVISECVRALKPSGSICWQIGNFVHKQSILPLDIALHPIFAGFGLTLRNRIVWHFEHGLHCSARFSGRYETILWYTKTNSYTFNLDAVRVPQKYPNKKHFKGPKTGQLSGNPMGKNPGDVWIIPNVKHNHVEKTKHPCQFPIELVERLVLSLTKPHDWVLDPFLGVGSTALAALLHGRKAVGADTELTYLKTARERIDLAVEGKLRIRPMSRPVYDPSKPQQSVRPITVGIGSMPRQPTLFQMHEHLARFQSRKRRK